MNVLVKHNNFLAGLPFRFPSRSAEMVKEDQRGHTKFQDAVRVVFFVSNNTLQ